MGLIFLSSALKALKQRCCNSKILTSSKLSLVARPTSSFLQFVDAGPSTAPAGAQVFPFSSSCRTSLVARPTSSFLQFVDAGPSTAPAGAQVFPFSSSSLTSSWTQEFEFSQTSCKFYSAFVNPQLKGVARFDLNSYTVNSLRPLPRPRFPFFVHRDGGEGVELIKKLSVVWRALNSKRGKSQSFWKYQCLSHGVFQDAFPSQIEYFEAVIGLFEKYNMKLILDLIVSLEIRNLGTVLRRECAGFWWTGISYDALCFWLWWLLGVDPRLWIWRVEYCWYLREVELVFDAKLILIDKTPWDKKHLNEGVYPCTIVWF